MAKVPLSFFNRPALAVAKELLGCYLVRRNADGIARSLITETEAYVGPHDLASHSSKGRTKRTEIMYQQAGTIYVYLIYGMHNMLNIVTGAKDYPAAVLIRAVEEDGHAITGPGKIAKELHVDRMMNGKLLGKESGLWVEFSTAPLTRKIIRAARIGVVYADPIWAEKKYRFLLKIDKTNKTSKVKKKFTLTNEKNNYAMSRSDAIRFLCRSFHEGGDCQ